MGKINVGRVILGGIVAGIVLDVLGYLVDGLLLARQWSAGMANLGRPQAMTGGALVWFNLLGIAGGLALVWVYAAIRPRFGAGIKTALCAGAIVWFIGTLLPNATFMFAAGLFGRRLTLYTTLGAIVEVGVAAIVGASLYREEAAAAAQPIASEKPRHAVQA